MQKKNWIMSFIQLVLGALLWSICFVDCSPTSTTPKPVVKKLFYNLSDKSHDKCGFSYPRGLDRCALNTYDDSFTNLGEFPWILAIYHNKIYIGAATLLQSDVVLTAAALIESIPTNELLIVAGEWDTHSETEPIPQLNRTVFAKAINGPLAILILDIQFRQVKNIGYMCLPTAETVFEWEVCKTTAWMMPTVKNVNASNILRKQDYRIMEQQDCGSLLPPSYVNSETGILDSSYLCAMDEMNNDSCMINAGAALFCLLDDASDNPRYVQAGIALMGTNCGKTKSPALFVSITKYMPWIEDILKWSSEQKTETPQELRIQNCYRRRCRCPRCNSHHHILQDQRRILLCLTKLLMEKQGRTLGLPASPKV